MLKGDCATVVTVKAFEYVSVFSRTQALAIVIQVIYYDI